MSLGVLLIVVAAVAALVLLFRAKSRLFPVVAVVASGLQALAVFDILRVESGVVSLPLVFGVAIAVAGAVLWTESKERIQVTAATLLLLVGLIQSLQGFGVI